MFSAIITHLVKHKDHLVFDFWLGASFIGWQIRHAQTEAKGQPMTVACITNATIAPPGLSLSNNTNHGKKIARIDIIIRFIMNPPFIELLIIDLS